MNQFETTSNILITKGELKEKTDKLAENKETIVNGKKYIIAMANEIKKLEAEISALAVVDDALTKVLEDNAKLLLNSPLIESASYEDEHFVATTTAFNAYTQAGDEIIIKPLRLQLSLLSSEVRINNLDRADGCRGYWTSHDPHPHVNGDDGTPCLGDASAPILEYVTNQEYYLAMMMVLEFVQNVNEDDSAGAKWENWNK